METNFFVITLLTLSLFSSQVQAMNRCLKMLDQRVTQEQLNLSGCNIQAEDVPIILSYLNGRPNVTSLNLSKNGITSLGIIALARNTTLTALNVNEDGVNMEAAKALANNTTLKTLDISENEITDEG